MKNANDQLLQELCNKYNVSLDKVQKLIETMKEYQFKDRRTGLNDALKLIIKSDLKTTEQQ